MKTRNRKKDQRNSGLCSERYVQEVLLSLSCTRRRWLQWLSRGESSDVEKVNAIEGKEDSSSSKELEAMAIEEYSSSPRLPRKTTFSALNPIAELSEDNSMSEIEPSSETSSESDEQGRKVFKVRKWPTRWYWQFLVLLVRTFRQSRHVILSKLNILQTVLLTTVASIVWFQLPKQEDSIPDRYGYVRQY